MRVTFAVEGPDGTVVSRGKNLDELQQRLAAPARQAVADTVGAAVERKGLRNWPADLDELPRVVEQRGAAGNPVRGYPALVDSVAAVDIRVFATEVEQAAAMPAGSARLLRLAGPSTTKTLEKSLDPRTRLVLANNPDGSLPALLDDCTDAAVQALVTAPVWTRTDFTAAQQRLAARLAPTVTEVVRRTEKVLTA